MMYSEREYRQKERVQQEGAGFNPRWVERNEGDCPQDPGQLLGSASSENPEVLRPKPCKKLRQLDGSL